MVADHFVLICASCRDPNFTDHVINTLSDRLPDGFAIRTVDCMAGCDRPATIGFQALGKAQYLFGDIATGNDLDAVVEFAEQYQLCADGWTNATERPRALFKKTLSRMPRIAP